VFEIKRILFACDLTEYASKILHYVISLAEKYDSEIYVMHVVQDLKYCGNVYLHYDFLNVGETEIFHSAEKALTTFCQTYFHGCTHVHKKIVSGMPSTEIIKTIKEEAIDLVVMGSHGYTGIEHTIFGSVAENVMKKSTVPVLVVNPYRYSR